jgi:transcriptional regulator with XRE-family HTH domain
MIAAKARKTPDGRPVYEPQEILGRVIRSLREEKKINQKDFAERIGISSSWLSRIESGNYDPPWSSVLRVVEGLAISLEELEEAIKSHEHSALPEGKE